MTDSTFSSSRGLGDPHGSLPVFFFRVIGGQEDFPLVRLGVALQMADAISRRGNRRVEVSGIYDVGLWEPVAGVGQLWAGLYEPVGKEGKRSTNATTV